MIVLNFSHPLTERHLQTISQLTAQDVAQVLDVWLDLVAACISSFSGLVVLYLIAPRAALAMAVPVVVVLWIGHVLANRLGRIVDRARFLESRPELSRHLTEASAEVELMRLAERKRWINRAITLCTLCALLVCTVIATLFVAAFVTLEIGTIVAGLFILSMLALIAGLSVWGATLLFQREVVLTRWT